MHASICLPTAPVAPNIPTFIFLSLPGIRNDHRSHELPFQNLCHRHRRNRKLITGLIDDLDVDAVLAKLTQELA
jgi:hypothetical protein